MGERLLEEYRRIKAANDANTGSFARDVNTASGQATAPTWADQNPDPTYDDPEEQAIMLSRKRDPTNRLMDDWYRIKAEGAIQDLRERKSAAIGQKNLKARNPFMRGLYRGFDTLQGTYQGGLGMLSSLAGDEPSAQQYFQAYQDEMRQASENPRDNIDFFSTDPKTGAFGSIGNFGTYAAGTLGEAVPSLAESVLTGIAGAALGAAVVPAPDPLDVATVPIGAVGGVFAKGAIKKAISSAAAEYVKQGVAAESAEQLARQYVGREVAKRFGSAAATTAVTGLQEGGGMYMEGREAGYDSPGTAMGLGLASGLSESLLGAAPGVLKSFAGRSGVDEIARREGWRAAAGYLWDTVKASGEEGVQEGFQEFLGSLNKEINDPKSDLFNKENFMQWAEAAAGGALVGGAVKSGTTGVELVGLRGGRGGRRGADSSTDPFIPQLPPGADTSEDPSNVQARLELLKRVVDEVTTGKRESFPRELAKQQGLVREANNGTTFIDIATGKPTTKEGRLASAQQEIANLEEQLRSMLGSSADEAVPPVAGQMPQVTPPPPPQEEISDNLSPTDPSGKQEQTPLYEREGEENMVARVFTHPQGFSVSIFDRDAGQTLPSISIFSSFEQAKQHADTVVSPGQQQPPTDPLNEEALINDEEVARQAAIEMERMRSATAQPAAPSLDQPQSSVVQPEAIPPSTDPFPPSSEQVVPPAAQQPPVSQPEGIPPSTDPFDVSLRQAPQEAQVQQPQVETAISGYRVQPTETEGANPFEVVAGTPLPAKKISYRKQQSPESQVAKQLEQEFSGTNIFASFADDPTFAPARQELLKEIVSRGRTFDEAEALVDQASRELLGEQPRTASAANTSEDQEYDETKQEQRQYLAKYHLRDILRDSGFDKDFTSENIIPLIDKAESDWKAKGVDDGRNWDDIRDVANKWISQQEKMNQLLSGKSSEYDKLPEATRTKFESAWSGNDPDAMIPLIHSGNKVLRSEFEKRSGEKLPKTAKGTKETVSRVYARRQKPTSPDAVSVGAQGEEVQDARGTKKGGDPNVQVQTEGGQRPSEGQISPMEEQAADEAPSPVSSIRRAIEENGGYDRNSADDVEAIRRKLYDGPNTPTHADIRAVMQDMKNEAGQKPAQENLSEDKKPSAESQSDEMPSYRDWRFVPKARNSGRIVPNKVGVKFSPSQMQSIARWAKERGYSVLDVKQTGITVIGKTSERLDIAKYGAAGVKAEESKAAADRRAENDRKADEDRKSKADGRESSKWIIDTFGADAMNDYNRNALSDFVEGVTGKFEGMISNKWSDGLVKIDAISMPEGRVDWAEVKRAYASHVSEEKLRERLKTLDYDNLRKLNRESIIQVGDEVIKDVGGLALEELNRRMDEGSQSNQAAQSEEGDEMFTAALAALDKILESEKNPPQPTKVGRKAAAKEATSQVTKRGQYVLPIFPDMAEEIDRQDFVRRYRDRVLRQIKEWSSDPNDQEDIQNAIDDIAPTLSSLISEMYRGKHKNIDDVYDSEIYDEIKDVAARFSFDETILLAVDEATERVLAERPVVKIGRKRQPRKSDQTKAEAKSDMQAAHAAAKALMEKIRNKLMSGVDPTLMAETVQVAYLYTKAGVKTFKAYVEAVTENFGDQFARTFAPYMESGWRALHARGVVSDPGGKVDDYLVKGSENETDQSGDGVDGDSPVADGAGEYEGDGTAAGDSADGGGDAEGNPGQEGGGILSGGRKASKRNGRGGSTRSGSDGNTDSGESEQGPAEAADSEAGSNDGAVEDRLAVNHVIGEDDNLAVSSLTESLRRNIKALEILKALESEGRFPDESERKQLAQYTGWGGLSQALDSIKGERMVNGNEWNRDEAWEKKWGDAYIKIKDLLTKEEFQAAQESTENAHYTSKPIIQSLWKIAERLGYNGGRVLELGAGVGHFAGLVPSRVRGVTQFVMVERDSVSSRIAKMLYPRHEVVAGDMEEFRAVPGSVTIGIGNVPFAGGTVNDSVRRYNEPLNLHNYSIARHLDAVAPGGVVVVISTHNTLDSSIKQRQFLATKGEFIGAIRLPNDAFAENAKTEVVTDILIFRRPRQGDPSIGVRFDQNADVIVKNKEGENITKSINKYFVDNPEMVLGMHSAKGSMYQADEYTVESTPGSLQDKLESAIERLPLNVLGKVDVAESVVASSTSVPFGRLEVRNGKVVMGFGDEFVPIEGRKFDGFPVHLTGKTGLSRAKDFIQVRDLLTDLRNVMLNESSSDDDVKKAQRKLNDSYDRYVSKHGPLNAQKTNIFVRDPDYYRVLALEKENSKYNPETKKVEVSYEKAAIFTQRVLGPQREPDRADSTADAMSISIAWRGSIDSAFVGKLLGVTPTEAESKLIEDGLAFRNPATTELEMSDLYLSGNVRAKLNQAKISAAEDPHYERNVEALEKVLPEDVTIRKDTVRLGATWVPESIINAFATEVLGANTRITYNANTDAWTVPPVRASESAKAKYATERIEPHDVLSESLNLRSIKIYDKVGTGEYDAKGREKTTQVLNEKETQAAKHRASVMRADFEKWVLDNPEVTQVLARIYNDKYNNFVRTKYNGDFLVLPGSSPEVKLRPYQKDAIWRIINRGTSLLAHAVGSGKTYTMIGAAMEMRRLGLARRPLLVVQNATLGQFATSFQKMYPNANVLVATKDDLGKGKRQLFLNKISTGNWDAVVMAQSTFDNMASDPDVERAFIQDQLDLLEEAIREEGGESNKTPTVKQLVRSKKSLKNRFDNLIGGRAKKEDNITFEDLGADALFLDEAHAYKKPTFATKLSGLVGLNTESSARSLSTTIKVRSVQVAHNGRNVVLATGTPVTNTLGEAWHMVNYVSPATNAAFSSRTFDQFIANFAQVEPTLTMNAGGQYVYKDAIVKFRNGQQLVEYINDSWDIVTPDALRAYMSSSESGLPELRDGKLTAITVGRTPGVEAFMDFISRVYSRYKSLTAKQRREMSFIPALAYGAARAATLDIRLVVPSAAEEKGSKLQKAADEIKRIYDETAESKGTQMFFSDTKNPFSMRRLEQFMGGLQIDAFEEENADVDPDAEVIEDDNESGSFLYQELKKKLLRSGIPAEQIAFISDAKTDKQRQALFERVNSGDIRILIGSTAKMGVGVNVQKKLVALHHFDTPWLPADLEQREGRILRFGNENKVVEILRYAMKKTLDGAIYMGTSRKQKFIWQVLNGQIEGDSFDDPSSASMLSIEEQLAAIQDDPLFFEKIGLQNRLRELELERQSFYDTQQRIASSLASDKWNLQRVVETHIPMWENRVAMLKDIKDKGLIDKFSFVHEQKSFDDPKKAAEFVKGKVEQAEKYVLANFDSLKTIDRAGGVLRLNPEQLVRFKIGPFDIVIGIEPAFASGDGETRSIARTKSFAYIDEPGGRRYDFYSGTATVPLTFFEKIQTLLDETAPNIKAEMDRAQRYRERIAELEGLSGKTWEDQAEYDEKKARLAEIEAQMLASSGSLTSGKAEDEKPLTDEEKNVSDKLDDINDTLLQTAPDTINREMLLQATQLAFAAEQAGIDNYDRLVAFAVKQLGVDRTRAIGAYLYHAGNAAGMKGVRPTRDVLGFKGVTREQIRAFAKAAFPMLPDEQIEAGLDIIERTGLGFDRVGFAPFGSPVPGQSLYQTNRRWHLKSRKLIQDKMGPKATSEQILGMLRKNGVNEEELYWSGLEELLGSRESVTKEEVLSAIDNGFQVGEVQLGEPYGTTERAEAALERLAKQGIVIDRDMDGEDRWFNTNTDEFVDESDTTGLSDEVLFDMDTVEAERAFKGGAKYRAYTIPGGKNHTELLITLPMREASNAYRSPHWDQPNVIAHLRMNERTDADGKRVMFIEEIQSDWHQEGRKKGYQKQLNTNELIEEYDEWLAENDLPSISADEHDASTLTSAQNSWLADFVKRWDIAERGGLSAGVPDAPFKKSWPALAMKRAIQYAAENGFDRIAWTDGEQQAERYDLSKQVDSVLVWGDSKSGYYYDAKKNNRSLVADKGSPVNADGLADAIGKELAEKSIADIEAGNRAEYSGVDLKVGGEGMKAFYDKMLPNEVNKLIKKFAVKVGQTTIKVPMDGFSTGERRVTRTPDGWAVEVLDQGEWNEEETFDTREDAEKRIQDYRNSSEGVAVPSFDITPAMRESAIQHGQTLFQNQEQAGNAKGWTTFISATRAIVGATNKADVSTLIHEIFHPLRRFVLDRSIPVDQRFGITDEEIAALEKYSGVTYEVDEKGVARAAWDVTSEEKAAKAWEQYWFEGKAPSKDLESLFEKISRWMRQVYESVIEITGGQPLPDDVRKLFDKLVQRGGGVPPGRTDTASSGRSRGEPLTSIKNEVAEEIAVRRGAVHMWDAATETQQEWLDDAESMLRSDPYIGQRLVRELNEPNGSRNLSNTEVAILQIYYRHVNNQYEAASDRMFTAGDRGDIVEKARLRIEVDAVEQELWNIEEAAKAAGREWGRAGVARQIVLRKDFSRAALLRRARVANAGNPLNEQQQEEIRKLAEQVADLEGKLAKAEQEKMDLERQLRADKDINEEEKRASETPRRPDSRKRASSVLQDFAKKFANIFGIKPSDTDTLQQTEEERMAAEAESVVQAYVEDGVFSFGEFLAKIKQDLGSDLPMQAQVAFASAWQKIKTQGDIPSPTVDATNATSLTRLARRIQRALVESGITDRDEVVDAVQESFREMDIELTKRETMDALSGYGQFTPLSDNQTDKIIRDINGQLQQVAKLQDMGYELIGDEWVKVRDGIAPSRTGGERRTPTNEERELIREVNEAKRRGGYKITDPESQLRTAVDAAKRAAANRIFDLKKAINEKKPIVANKTSLAGQDAELDNLRKELAEWTEKYRDMFPKPEATMEQRIAATNRVLDAEIAAVRRQLLSGDVLPKGRKEPVSTPEIEAKRARLKALREQREQLQLMLDPNMKDKLAAKAYKAALLKQIADYQDRKARNDFDPKPKKSARILTNEELVLKRQLEQVKNDFFRKAADYRLANMSPVEKAWDYTKETSHLSRALMTSFDLSAVFRQGGVASFSHPKLAAMVGRDMIKALRSEQANFDIAEKIRNHPLYQFAMTAKLAITEDEQRITKQEEAFMGRWVRWGIGKEGSAINKWSKKALSPVAASGRAYTTYLNGMRFELFRQMVDGLGGMGKVTADEAKVIATFVNVATGRADLGKFNQAAANMSVIFFAPRYVASRFQYLAMPFYLLPNSKISGRVRKVIAMEYARYLGSVSLFLGSVVVFGNLLAGDDDDWLQVDLDPRSSDFLKIRIGETRIDPMAGFSQIATFTTQALYGQRKRQDGEIRDLRGENHKPLDKDTWDVVSDFVRKKLAPIPGAFIDLIAEENVIGEKETPMSVATGLFVPLSWGEVKESMQSRGVPAGTAISVLALLGMGGGTYGPKTKYANSTKEEREKQLAKYLEEMEFDSKDPAYSEFLTTEQLEQVKARREERKQDLAYAASASPNRSDYQSDESYKKAVASRDKAVETMRQAKMSPNEISALLLDYWKRTSKSPYELRGGVFKLKKPVQERLMQLRRQFSEN